MSKKGSIDNPIELSSSPVKTKAIEVIMVDDDSDSEENEQKTLSSPMPSSSSTPSLLNKEQAEILKYVNRPESPSIFITGSAGVGKSFLLQEIIKSRKARWSGSAGAVAITAPTGIAASNIGGRTIHSFAGIGLGKGDEEKIIKKAAYAKTSR
jgi:ATP-dependent DNA helicase PIF1